VTGIACVPQTNEQDELDCIREKTKCA